MCTDYNVIRLLREHFCNWCRYPNVRWQTIISPFRKCDDAKICIGEHFLISWIIFGTQIIWILWIVSQNTLASKTTWSLRCINLFRFLNQHSAVDIWQNAYTRTHNIKHTHNVKKRFGGFKFYSDNTTLRRCESGCNLFQIEFLNIDTNTNYFGKLRTSEVEK